MINGEWGTRVWMNERDRVLLDWFNGDEDALNFLRDISDATELWDDMIDQDKELTEDKINSAFFKMLVSIPNNAFFQKNRLYLTPIIIQCINAWHDANKLEKGDANQRALAYTLRNIDIMLMQSIVFLTSGYPKMREVSEQVWTEFAAKQDDALRWINGE